MGVVIPSLLHAFQRASDRAHSCHFFLWDSLARTMRSEPRVGISTDEANRGNRGSEPERDAKTITGMHLHGDMIYADQMTAPAMESTIRALLEFGKGILAADESFPTIGKR